jgi:hypothetical protein
VVAGAIFFFVLVPLAIIFLALAALGVLVIYIRLRLRRLFAGPRAREGRVNVRVREPNDA